LKIIMFFSVICLSKANKSLIRNDGFFICRKKLNFTNLFKVLTYMKLIT